VYKGLELIKASHHTIKRNAVNVVKFSEVVVTKT